MSKKNEITITDMVDQEKTKDSLFNGLLKLVQNTEATSFIVNTLKNSIPNLTSGMIAPKDAYYDDKKNALHIAFDIKVTEEELYSVEIVISKKENSSKYSLNVESEHSKFTVSFEQMVKLGEDVNE